MIYLLLLFYVFVAVIYLVEWMGFFLEDNEMSPSMRLLSILVLIVATLLWPFIIPFAYRELLKFHKKHKQVITLLMNLPDTTVINTDRLATNLRNMPKSSDTPIYGFSFKDED